MVLDMKYVCIYNCIDQFEWDENKRIQNVEKHGLDFLDAHELWDAPMLIARDDRYDYGENRFIALGSLRDRIVVCAYTEREKTVCIISFRKANSREVKQYEKIIKENP